MGKKIKLYEVIYNNTISISNINANST